MTRWENIQGRTRWLVGAGALALVVAVVLAVVLGSRGSDDGTAAGSSSSPTATTLDATPTTPPAAVTPVPTPTPTGPTDVVDDLPPSLTAVALDGTAAVGDGVTGALVEISPVDASAEGPGNVDGPALAIVVRITNGTAGPVQLDGVQVNLSYSTDQLAGSPVDDARAAPMTGALAAGESAEGTYVFSVPADQRDTITVTVGYQAGAPLMVFTGPAD